MDRESLIISILALGILLFFICIACFCFGIIGALFTITGPGESRSIKLRAWRRTFLKISYSRTDKGRGSLQMRFIKNN